MVKAISKILPAILIPALFIAAYFNRGYIISLFQYSECGRPVFYKIDKIDSRFGISQDFVKGETEKASNIWNLSYGKKLFVYSQSAPLTINFIYDQRSGLISEINNLQDTLDNRNATLDQQISAYESALKVYEQKVKDFNLRVSKINKSGGAKRDLYNELIAEQIELAKEGDALNSFASQLNLATQNYNLQVENLNQNIDQFNQEIQDKPEEGLYDPNDNTISIYLYSSEKELTHTLAHEFGHALGMEHTADPKSIMFPYTSENTEITPQDEAQLEYACRKQSITKLWANYLNSFISKDIPLLISNLRK